MQYAQFDSNIRMASKTGWQSERVGVTNFLSCQRVWRAFEGQKISTNFSAQSFSRTLRVMDVHARKRGCPCPNVCVPEVLVMGTNSSTPPVIRE